jgi:hypothetical protein
VKTLDQVAAEATEANVRLRIDTDALTRAAGTTVDGFFYTPLLALTVLVIIRGRKSGLPTSDIATWALGTLVKHFETLRLARGRIQWSVVLRRRCADAVVFLENVGLAGVHEAPTRTVHITLQGREFVGKLARGADETGVLLRQLERAHRAVEQGGLELL